MFYFKTNHYHPVVKSGPLTRKKLGLKDVLGKLAHFSLSVRFDSLEGLKVSLVRYALWGKGLLDTWGD